MKFTEDMPTTEDFRLWSAIAAIASVVDRKCWVKSLGGKLHPNLFIMLVGDPTTGKSKAINPAREIVLRTGKIFMAPKKVTRASLEDFCQEVMLRAKRPTENGDFPATPVTAIADEFSSFCPAHDMDFLSFLTVLYDCTEKYESTIRSKEKATNLDRTSLNMLTGAQPGFLGEFLPEVAWQQGFMSRTIMVHGDKTKQVRKPLFMRGKTNSGHQKIVEGLRSDLIFDLKLIGSKYGEIEFTNEAMDILEAWHEADQNPKPEHPKLQNYNGRRIEFIFKLCMVFSLAEGDSLQIEGDHARDALAALEHAEAAMPEIFKSMSVAGHGAALDELWAYMWREWCTNGNNSISETQVFNFLRSRIPVQMIVWSIDTAVKSGMIRKAKDSHGDIGSGAARYEPIPDTQRNKL